MNELKKEMTITFVYKGGNHPNKTRDLTIDTVYPNGDIGGYETTIANGEYRRFKRDLMTNIIIHKESDMVELKISRSQLDTLIEIIKKVGQTTL